MYISITECRYPFLPFKRSLDGPRKQGFVAMNEAIKREAEGK
jgi:hypothetical protein